MIEHSIRRFTALDSVTHEGLTNTWFTPRELIQKLGSFELDPCTESYRPFDTAEKHFCFDKGENGLTLPWNGRVWLNPPYGRVISQWLDKLAEHGNGVALVFARTETGWAQKHLGLVDAVNFLAGRISFIKANGRADTNAGTGSLLLAYGKENAMAIRAMPGVILTR